MDTSVAAVVGALSFIGYFHHGEHHLYSAMYFGLFLAIYVTSVAFLIWAWGDTVGEALKSTTSTATFFLVGLYGSCLLYRTSPLHHPLRKFPGPFGARISSLWLSFQLGKRHQAHVVIRDLHQKYGKIVRVGSNDLSIIHPKAIEKIHGASSKCQKSIFYDMNEPVTSIQTTRDRVLHDQRRRLWSTAFTETRLREYEPKIKAIHKHLLARIDKDSQGGSSPINVTRLINLYAFDIMGEIAYGTHFNMLNTGRNHQAVSLLNESMAMIGFMLPVWLIRFAVAVPGLMDKWRKFIAYCYGQLEICRSEKMDMPIIASSLLSPYKDRELSPAEKNLLHGEAQLLVVAGSDTTSATLKSAIFELARNPRITEQLREDISKSLGEETDIKAQRIQNLDILNGVINEALRLYPPVPTSLWRQTPTEGLWIDDDTYIPGNVTVSTPHYVFGRSNDAYEDPDKFVPERWYSKPEMVKQDKVYAPFSIGPYSCVGRPLAMLNLRLTLAQLVHTYDFEFAKTTTTSAMEEEERAFIKWEESIKDTFTLVPGQLSLRFRKRIPVS